MRELEELRLDVRTCAPERGVQPRPADLDGAVLRPQGEEARRAGHLVVTQCHKGDLRPFLRGRQRLLEPRAPLVAGLWLSEAEPLPGSRVARGLPQPFLVPRLEWLEADDAALEDGNVPPLQGADSTLGSFRSTSKPAWHASRILRNSFQTR